ncbi:MAG TPA: DUF2071 domain-containing protein, partial [Gemmatales bacterium]|nr:DUF2071 domain-containing protein [Gemmatales bacterium]
MQRCFMTATWRQLLMLNFEIDPDLLAPRVPRGTELDTYSGRHYVSLVGFRFLNTRVLGVPIPGHRHFDEANLRFYVRRRGPEGWRRGVVFIKEIVPRWAIATVARWIYHEPYVALPMWHRWAEGREVTEVAYGWGAPPAEVAIRAEIAGAPEPLRPGSEEEFITEHYWGY